MGIGFAKVDVEEMPTEQLESLSPVIRELWVDEVDELIFVVNYLKEQIEDIIRRSVINTKNPNI